MELKNTEKQEHSVVALTIEITKAEFEAAKDKAFKKTGKNITVPGFRKGKAPRKMIEKLYGEGVFFEEAFNIIYPDAMEMAVEKSGIKPVGRADVDLGDPAEEGGLTIIAKVPVEPEVELGEYKGIEVEKETVKVLQADVKAELNRMAQRNARTETVERKAKKNDTVDIDFEGFVDGVPFEGGKAEHHELTLGSGAFIPGFEDQLIGCKASDEKDVVVTFPEEYHAKELAGKEATFKCKVHKVEETILPEIDDEFAKDVSDTCETLDDLKKEITERLKAERQEAADNAFEEKVLDAVIDGMKADIPAAMIDSQVDTIVQDFGYRLQMQGMGLEQYLKMTGTEMGAFRAMFQSQAERQVKTRLALQKVVELEGITVSDTELEEEYAKMAEQYKMEVEKVKAIVSKEALEGDLKISNALEFIKKNAKVKKAAKKKAAEETTEETAE
ncbi:trigger factor [Butyricicoccus faecihominis]|uniref:Trigger factor n=1 Tax=Butyricicoccus faecihominis TaxID=1712515 RepID=A0ABQ1E1V6_9FIRM|nr:trigger factor [Butyricicoccus faecihominis]GFO88961.1 trigger factor [Butyricicoccus faecihominis]GGM67378.1 trigger factor [Butyricicoccus faecihominis]